MRKRQLSIYHENHDVADDYCFDCKCQVEDERLTYDSQEIWSYQFPTGRNYENRKEW